MKHYTSLKRVKWNPQEGYGICVICDKWKKTMYFFLNSDFLTLCRRDFEDLKG